MQPTPLTSTSALRGFCPAVIIWKSQGLHFRWRAKRNSNVIVSCYMTKNAKSNKMYICSNVINSLEGRLSEFFLSFICLILLHLFLFTSFTFSYFESSFNSFSFIIIGSSLTCLLSRSALTDMLVPQST